MKPLNKDIQEKLGALGFSLLARRNYATEQFSWASIDNLATQLGLGKVEDAKLILLPELQLVIDFVSKEVEKEIPKN